jgi:hypothetical protein
MFILLIYPLKVKIALLKKMHPKTSVRGAQFCSPAIFRRQGLRRRTLNLVTLIILGHTKLTLLLKTFPAQFIKKHIKVDN